MQFSRLHILLGSADTSARWDWKIKHWLPTFSVRFLSKIVKISRCMSRVMASQKWNSF